jgi:cell division transport system ATP-binding protein
VIKVLEKINRYGTTVILTTHNAEIVNKLKRRVIVIKDGKIASDRANAEYNGNGGTTPGGVL